MSDTGLYSGIYEQLRDFAEFLDDVLMDLKTDRAEKDKVEKLGEKFRLIGNKECSDLTIQLVKAVLDERLEKPAEYWKEVGEKLILEDKKENVIPTLESVAKVLERERAGVLAKLRGY